MHSSPVRGIPSTMQRHSSPPRPLRPGRRTAEPLRLTSKSPETIKAVMLWDERKRARGYVHRGLGGPDLLRLGVASTVIGFCERPAAVRASLPDSIALMVV
jgi:hypothetical protein